MAGARRVRRIVAVPRRASKQGRTVVGLILAHIVALQPLHCCTVHASIPQVVRPSRERLQPRAGAAVRAVERITEVLGSRKYAWAELWLLYDTYTKRW
jgi:hypothetical protein